MLLYASKDVGAAFDVVTPIWFAVLGVAYAVVRKSPPHQARMAERKAMADAETREAATAAQ